MTAPSPWASLVGALSAATSTPASRPQRFNPRPAGFIQPGGATEKVLAVLRAEPARFWTAGQIEAAVGRSRSAVSWALLYLRDRGLIDVVGDGTRNSRYLRYTSSRNPDGSTTQTRPIRMAGDASTVLGSEVPGLVPLRWSRDPGQPEVAHVRGIPGGHGLAASAGLVAWASRRDQALHQRELPLDHLRAAASAAPGLPADRAPGRPDADGLGDRSRARHAQPEHGDAARRRSTPAVGIDAEAVPSEPLDHVGGRDAAAARVGAKARRKPKRAARSAAARDGSSRSNDGADQTASETQEK